MNISLNTLADSLTSHFSSALLAAYPTLTREQLSVEVVQSTQEKFGHYQCNSPMKLAKLVGKSPRVIAQEVLDKLDRCDADGSPFISHTEIAGPGFINITIDGGILAKKVKSLVLDSRVGIPLPAQKQKVIVELSSPNTAKEMHVGHLRSTIIGDCLARAFEFLGHDVLRLNHVGDWGTSFGMLIAYMKDVAQDVLSGKMPMELGQLVKWYKEAKKRFDEDAPFKLRSQQEVVALQGGDASSLSVWGQICEVSRLAYQEIYNILDVRLIERGESFYNSQLPGIVADLEKKGLVQLSDGAKCIFLEGFVNREGEPFPLMIQKGDGGYNYDTTDMAAIRQRVDVEKADRIIYVVDAGQSLHFSMIFKAAEKAGYFDSQKVQVEHVPFGLVLGSDGKRFRTRSGETERLIDLLKAAVIHAKKILVERKTDMPESELDNVAEALGIGAVKYADLSCHRTGDYVFSYERMLKFEGNTAAFLMYAYVRVAGIKRKVGIDVESLKEGTRITLGHPSEVALAIHLLQFGESLEKLSKELLPNRLTDYLYTLAEKFNAFFRDCRVEGSPEQNSRLLLCEGTARVMRQGLDILGVIPVSRM